LTSLKYCPQETCTSPPPYSHAVPIGIRTLLSRCRRIPNDSHHAALPSTRNRPRTAMHRRCHSLAVEAAGRCANARAIRRACRVLARDLPETALRVASRHPTIQPLAASLTCAVAWERRAPQGIANPPSIDGMQGVRGSNPLSSTPGQRPSPPLTARESFASGSKLAAICPDRPIQRPVGRCRRPASLALSRGGPGLTRAGGLGRARRRIGSAGHGKIDHRLAS
jgi:hypothetical protein